MSRMRKPENTAPRRKQKGMGMARFTKEDIFRMVKEEDVEFIRLQFCDIFGMPKNLAVTASQLEKALNNECSFDATAIEGFRDTLQEMYLYPDLDTFDIFPWRPQTGKVARMYCDIYTEEGMPFGGDSRQVLRRVLKEAEQMGCFFEVQPELEFFLFHTDDYGRPTTTTHESAGCYDVAPSDLAENVRRDIILTLENMGCEILGSHHEISPAQHEIDFGGGRADKAADQVITFRQAVRTVAKKHGLYATFMPKPRADMNGSGMHLRIQCRDRLGRNLFSDENGEGRLSGMGRAFTAGLLEHAAGMTLITNPLVNSYKRLVSGFDAPTAICWSDVLANRQAFIHVSGKNADSTRIELRSPDCVCNPYLAFAVCIAAGLDGIKRNLNPPELIRENLTEKTDEQISALSLRKLPETLGEALEACENDPMIRETLGEKILNGYRNSKKKEWEAFRKVVTNWEIENFLEKY